MKTKLLMSSSAVVFGLLGLVATFLPEEILLLLESDQSPLSMILLQVIGGLYLGFAILNWMTRSARIGGIYSRPIVLGNMMHFIVVAFALIGQLFEQFNILFVLLFGLYLIFAFWFGVAFMSNPLTQNMKKAA